MKRRIPVGALMLSLGFSMQASTAALADGDAKVLVAPYLRARDDFDVGVVVGRALGDPARPTAAAVPYEGVSVMLLPHSALLEEQLDAIKAHFRDSLTRYMEATADVTEVRSEFERALLEAGGGELIRGEVSDAQGFARFAAVPTGTWLVLAWRTQSHASKGPQLRRQDTTAFREMTVSAGYSTVSYWLMRVSVRSNETSEVDLNDRNVWLTGIKEDLRQVEGQPKKSGPKQRR